MTTLDFFLIAIALLPLLACVATAVLGKAVLREQSHLPAVIGIGLAFVCSLGLLVGVLNRQAETAANVGQAAFESVGYEHVFHAWTWAEIPDARTPEGAAKAIPFRVDVSLRADALTAMMLCMVTFVATCVAIFASGYMQGDPGYSRFFTYVCLFVFSMVMLVSVSNFLLLFVFWEAVGVCSYLLIGFWYEKPEAAAAGKKAFLVNRVGDFGLTLALFLIWMNYGTLNFHDTQVDGSPVSATATIDGAPAANVVSGVLGQSRLASHRFVGGATGVAICLLLLLGACGKSAQFPLHLWLPDAMEGPTPVSALIHAATMVTAGVYMTARCTPLFTAAPEAQLVVAMVGGFTALLAGLIALTQFDLKRVMAYSTVSQLGFMFLGIGTGTFGGVTAAMFHLFTHAFFKALLFLGSGSVMHAMHHVIDMRKFSGLKRILPVTHATMLVGCLALAGVFPLAGFWSKDAILGALHDRIHALEHDLEHSHAVKPTPVENPAFVSKLSDAPADASHGVDRDFAKRALSIYWMLYYGALFTAFLTAFYTFRAFFLTFYGEERVPPEAGDHAHESPPTMTWPLIALAACAVIVGFGFMHNGLASNRLVDFLGTTPSLATAGAGARPEAKFHLDVAGLSVVVAVAGILAAMYFYMGDRGEAAALRKLFSFEGADHVVDAGWLARVKSSRWGQTVQRFAKQYGLSSVLSAVGFLIQMASMVIAIVPILLSWASPYRLSLGKFYWDEICWWAIVKPLEIVADVLYALDRVIVDGMVDLIGAVPKAIGGAMRGLQMGQVQFYALGMVFGAAMLVAARVFFAR